MAAHHGGMLHGVLTLDQAIASGVSRRKVYRLVEQGTWQRLHAGVFLTRPVADADPGSDTRWKAELAARLLYGGAGSMVSHRAAAVLHRLEGITGLPLDVTVPTRSRHLPVGAHRSKLLDPNPVMIDGLTTTSVARTLRDIAVVCGADLVEQALESALRGPDRRRPDEWNTELLTGLRAMVTGDARLPGSFLLRTVLNRRSDADRPTGSFPETLLFQTLRTVGLTAVRQATLRIVDPTGLELDTLFPDLSLPEYLLLIEVDGAGAHTGQAALQRDLRRQNKVLRGFRLLRFTAVEVLTDPAGVADEIHRSVRGRASLPTRESGDVSVTYSTNEFLVVDAGRSAREEAARRRQRR